MILAAVALETAVLIAVLTWQHRDTMRAIRDLAAIIEYLTVRLDQGRER